METTTMRQEKKTKKIDVNELISLQDLIKQYSRMVHLQETAPVPYYKKCKDDTTLKRHQRTRSVLHWLKLLQSLSNDSQVKRGCHGQHGSGKCYSTC